MDERRQGIADLRKRIDEYERALDRTEEKLGEAALSRENAAGVFAEEAAEKKRLERDLSAARAGAKSIEEDTERLHELTLAERDGKRRLESLRAELFELRSRLGEAVLSSSQAPDLFSPFRDRIDLLASKIEEQDARIAELEADQGDAGLISHIGKTTRSTLLRASQSARRAEGRRILAEAGAALATVDELSSSEDDAVRSAYAALAANAADAERCRAELLDIQDSMKALRAQSVAGIGANNPRRAAARLEKDIHDAEARIASLHREVGARIVGLILGPDRAGRRKDPLSDFVAEFSSDPGTAEIIEEAKACTASISSAERRIQKLEASLRVDALSAELLRLRRTAADHERRIASSKVALQDLGLRIAEAEREIASLSKALGDD